MTAGPTQSAALELGVVVVNYGSSALLREHLHLVVGEHCRRVVVVDNHTTEAESRALCALAAARGWDVVLQSDNRGFGAGCNAGARRAAELGCEMFLMLNPDAVVTPEVVAALADQVAGDPAAVVTPTVVRSDGVIWFRGGRLDLATGRTRTVGRMSGDTVPWLTAACLAVHRVLWERLGGFDERFFLYWEDV